MGTVVDPALGSRLAANRDRQRELYGVPLGDRVRRLTRLLGITQARLARTLGVSPAMLSQLVSARRVKIGDPAVLARLLLLDQRCAGQVRVGPGAVSALLDEVAAAQLQWSASRTLAAPARPGVPAHPAPAHPAPARPAPARPGASSHPAPAHQLPTHRPPVSRPPIPNAVDALRRVAAPARLAAAAATLAPGFPELAEVLRQAAGRPRAG
jgi:transcriptional regulator with XRE-family HTH domain